LLNPVAFPFHLVHQQIIFREDNLPKFTLVCNPAFLANPVFKLLPYFLNRVQTRSVGQVVDQVKPQPYCQVLDSLCFMGRQVISQQDDGPEL